MEIDSQNLAFQSSFCNGKQSHPRNDGNPITYDCPESYVTSRFSNKNTDIFLTDESLTP